MLGDMLGDRGDWSGAARWFGELIARYPADLRASVARFRLAAQAVRDGGRDSAAALFQAEVTAAGPQRDRKSTRLNSSHLVISYAVFCLKKKKKVHRSGITHSMQRCSV